MGIGHRHLAWRGSLEITLIVPIITMTVSYNCKLIRKKSDLTEVINVLEPHFGF